MTILTMKQRDDTRKLQDTLLRLCNEQGLTDSLRVSENMPADITIGALRMYIYPDYTSELNTVLRYMQGED
jgi:hypothetical protein